MAALEQEVVLERTRAELSRLTCQALAWFKADGGLKDMSARVAMLRMQKDGLIELPPPRCKRPDPRVRIGSRSDPGEPLDQPARALTPLALRRVRTNGESRLWNEYIQRYHYLGHKPLPGAQLRYIVYSGEEPIAVLGFGAAAWMSAPRDRYIGWTHDQRKRNLSLIVNNARFLILPWIQSKNLASMLLAKAVKILPHHWQEVYGYRPVLLETFVEKPRFRGTCYKAANWVCTGQTKGTAKKGHLHVKHGNIKDVYLYPLRKDFRNKLNG